MDEEKKEGQRQLMASFLTLASALNSHSVPTDDAKDMRNGANYIPYEVTGLRRKGKKVRYLGDNRWKYEDRIIT